MNELKPNFCFVMYENMNLIPAVQMTGVKLVMVSVVELALTRGWVKMESGVVEGGAGAGAGASAGCCCCCCCCSTGAESAVEAGVVSCMGFDAVTGTVSAGGDVDVTVGVGVASGADAIGVDGFSASSCLSWEGSSETDAGNGVDVETAEGSRLGSKEGSSDIVAEIDSGRDKGSGSGGGGGRGVASRELKEGADAGGAVDAGVNENALLVSDAAALSGGLKLPGILEASAVALSGSESFPAGFGVFTNVNVIPVLPGGLKLNGALGLGDSLTLSPGLTLRPEKGPRESS